MLIKFISEKLQGDSKLWGVWTKELTIQNQEFKFCMNVGIFHLLQVNMWTRTYKFDSDMKILEFQKWNGDGK